MDARLLKLDGSEPEPDLQALATLLGDGTPFWLDVAGLEGDDASLLATTFGFHPLAVEDAEHFGQRPKLDDYEQFSLLVVYGAAPDGRLVEVHCFYARGYLVTVHRDPCADLDDLADRLRRHPGAPMAPIMLLHQVIDALVDSFFPVLADLDDQIDELEDEILKRPTEAQLGRLFSMKRDLIALRKVVTPERDLLASLIGARSELPGMDRNAERYFRDLYDHLVRVSDLVDSYRDLLSGALDTHLSTVSNRLNVVMKQLTIIATVFLPLGFLTGFFGQNFSFLVRHLVGLPVFLGAAIGLPIATVVLLVGLFHRRGWLSPDGTPPEAPSTRRAGERRPPIPGGAGGEARPPSSQPSALRR